MGQIAGIQKDRNIFLDTIKGIMLLWLSSTNFLLKLRIADDSSYGVYLWGFVVQQSIHTIFPNWGSYLHMTVAIIISVIVEAISCFWVEKPGMKIAKRISNMPFAKSIPF